MRSCTVIGDCYPAYLSKIISDLESDNWRVFLPVHVLSQRMPDLIAWKQGHAAYLLCRPTHRTLTDKLARTFTVGHQCWTAVYDSKTGRVFYVSPVAGERVRRRLPCHTLFKVAIGHP